MELKFDDAFDLENELPDALYALSYLVEALPHYQHAVGTNEKAEQNVNYFLATLIGGVAKATQDYIDEKVKGAKNETHVCNRK